MTPLIEPQKLNRFYCHSYGKGLSGGRIDTEEESPFLSPSGGLCPETEYQVLLSMCGEVLNS